MFNLDSLTPEEKAELKAALDGQGHPDEAQDAAMMDNSNDAIANILEAIVDRLENLEKAVFDELIGGVKNLYNTNKRKMGVDSLKGKYGKDIDQYADGFRDIQGGADLYDKLYDHIEELRSAAGEGWNDEAEGGVISGIMETLKKHLLPKIAEAGPEIEIETEGKEPEGVEIKTTEIGATGDDELVDMIKKQKKGRRLPNE
jgi:hypothetical protein